MGLAVLDLTALRTVQCDEKKLRWVESQKTFYQADPSSTATDNGYNVIQPNVGNGRWIIQAGTVTPTVTGVVETKTTSFTAQPNYHYILEPSGNITATLPAMPEVGNVVTFTFGLSIYNYANRCVIDRNGNKINEEEVDYFVAVPKDSLVFRYLNTAIGWTVEVVKGSEDTNRYKYTGTIVNYPVPANVGVSSKPQGIIHRISTNWGNQSAAVYSSDPVYKTYFGGFNPSAFAPSSFISFGTGNTTSSRFTIGGDHLFLTFFFHSRDNATIYPVKISDMFIAGYHILDNATNNENIFNFSIYGSNFLFNQLDPYVYSGTSGIDLYQFYSGNNITNALTASYLTHKILSHPTTERLISYDQTYFDANKISPDWRSYRSILYPVNSTKYFTTYTIVASPGNSSLIQGSQTLPTYVYLNWIEFFGDMQEPLHAI